MPPESLPKVAVIGYPNVGKSTLVNRLSGTRETVTHAEPGVTRDRKEVPAEWNGVEFLLVDTGGVDLADPAQLQADVQEQARFALADADAVLLVVDATVGRAARRRGACRDGAQVRASGDRGRQQARSRGPTRRRRRSSTALGLGEPAPASAAHGVGTGDLLDRLVRSDPARGRRSRAPGTRRRGAACADRPSQRRQVVAAQRLPGRAARDRRRGGGNDARRDRHAARGRRPDAGARGHRRAAASLEGRRDGRLLRAAALRARRRARRRRAGRVRRLRGDHERRPADRRPRDAQRLRDAPGAEQVGRHADRPRGRQAPRHRQAAASPAGRSRRPRRPGATSRGCCWKRSRWPTAPAAAFRPRS